MNSEAERLRQHVEWRFECRAVLQRVEETPVPGDRVAAPFVVHVFDLIDHPIAKQAYAWDADGVLYAVQNGWFVRSPKDAVREARADPSG